MTLDEIYQAIREKREGEYSCPFVDTKNHEECKFLFPEIVGHYWLSWSDESEHIKCPCHILGNDYVKSEMRRLFP